VKLINFFIKLIRLAFAGIMAKQISQYIFEENRHKNRKIQKECVKLRILAPNKSL